MINEQIHNNIIYVGRKSDSLFFSGTMFMCLSNSGSLLSVWMFEVLRSWNLLLLLIIIPLTSLCGALVPPGGESGHDAPVQLESTSQTTGLELLILFSIYRITNEIKPRSFLLLSFIVIFVELYL